MRSHEVWWSSRRAVRAKGRRIPQMFRLMAMLSALAVIVACGAPSGTTQGGEQASQPAASAAAQGGEQASASAAAAEAPTPAPTATAIPISTVGSGGTKIVWWHISTAEDQRAYWQNLANTYVQQNPDVSIEITVLENEAFKSKLATAMQSGSPPDIFQSWGGGVLKQYGEAGLVQDLTSALQENGWGDSFNAAPLGNYTFDGTTYGVPWDAGMVGFWYNKGLFEKAGITTPPTTWTEFLDAVKKLKAAGITPIAVGEKDKWPGHFYWVYLATRIGGREAFEKAYNREGSFADPAFVQAGERLKELVDLQPFQNGFLGAAYGDHQVQMANGQAAMELMGQWAPGANRAVAQDAEAYNQNLGWFPFPAIEGGAGDPSDALGGGDGFAIGKNAPPAAIDFVRFLTNQENQTEMAKVFGQIPTVKGAQVADPLLQQVADQLAQAKYYQLYYDQYLPPAVGQAVNDATQGIFAGTTSPQDVATTIEEAAAAELTQ